MSEKKPEFEAILDIDLGGYRIRRAYEVQKVHSEHVKNPAVLQSLLGFLLNESIAKAYVEVLGREGDVTVLSLKETFILTSDTKSFDLGTTKAPIKVISDDAAKQAIRAKVKAGMSADLYAIITGFKS